MGHKMTSFFTGIKKEQSKDSIIKICCNKSVISMSKSRPSAKNDLYLVGGGRCDFKGMGAPVPPRSLP